VNWLQASYKTIAQFIGPLIHHSASFVHAMVHWSSLCTCNTWVCSKYEPS